MSAELSQPAAAAPGSNEPATKDTTIPVWLIVLVVLMLYGGAVYFDERSGWFNPQVYEPYRSLAQVEMYQPKSEGPDLSRGKRNFEMICALCHGANGAGTAQAPPLVGSEWVNGSPERLIRIPLYGLSGTVTVKGQAYNFASSMGPMGAGLSPEDLSLVLTYIRSSWGNNGSPVTPAQVSAVKTQVGNRPLPFTVDELNAIH
jgi:mono/diheme cytochrome c family protein